MKRLSAINFSVVKDMVMTWVMTFPGCGIIGFLIAKLFMMLFHGQVKEKIRCLRKVIVTIFRIS